MKVLFWNIRGMGSHARKRQLKELLNNKEVDIVCLQETKKELFTERELNSFQGGKNFSWCWKASRGASGGILIGVNSDLAEAIETHVGAFFLSCVLKIKKDNFVWEIVCVYGPVDNTLKNGFLDELSWHIQFRLHPVLLGGDFNMYRFASEKSNGNLDLRCMNMFNNFITGLDLRELHRIGPRFTWTNKQDNPTQKVLDRILVTDDWDNKYPNSVLSSILRVGSDHIPILLDTCEGNIERSRYFKFESAWLAAENFKEMVTQKMPTRDDSYILEFWNKKQAELTRFLKGWGINAHCERVRGKQVLQKKLEMIEAKALENELSPDEWQERYALENNLEQLYEMEELYWHNRSGGQWILEGDRNTDYCHRIANERKKRCSITSLMDGDTELTSKEDLKNHIVNYSKSLFRADPSLNIHLSPNVWEEEFFLKPKDREVLIRPFKLEELDKVLKEAKLNTAPGPDGFSIPFYRAFWPHLQNDIFEMLLMLHNEELDLKRLNFGVISLIPKNNDPSDIKQFRPICVLNDCFKFISKVVTNRFSEVANGVISPTQTAFIPGRFILEGCVIIHEVLHELRIKNLEGIILKIDFEKAYDKVKWDFLFEVMEKKRFPPKWFS